MNAKKKHDTATQKSWLISSLERITEKDPDKALFIEFSPDKRVISRGKFLENARKIAHFMQDLGITSQMQIIIDIDMKMHWEAFASWCASQMIGAAAFFWPPDMRFRFAKAETDRSDEHNHAPAPVITATLERARKWRKTDAESGLPARPILCLESGTNDDFIPFKKCLDAIPLEKSALCTDEAALVYTQGSHQDARSVPLSFAHLEAQAEDLQKQFNLDESQIIAIDLKSIHTTSLAIFGTCVRTGSTFVCRSESIAMLQVIQDSCATLAFCLPTTLQKISRSIQNPQSSAWRAFCLKLGKYRQRHPDSQMGSIIRKICTDPVKNKYLPSIQAFVSYGNHFNSKLAELFSFIGIPSFNAYTVAEFGFVHIHEFMGKGGFLKSIEPKIKSGILSIRAPKMSQQLVCMDDLVFEDERCGLCTHRQHLIHLEGDKTASVSPTREFLRQNPIIEDIFVFGENRPYLTALIYLNKRVLLEWAHAHNLTGSFEELSQNPTVYKFVRGLVEKSNLRRSPHESIQKIALLQKTLSEDPRIQTPCALTRIPDIERRYAHLIDSFYHDSF